jgi:hypothetical protein
MGSKCKGSCGPTQFCPGVDGQHCKQTAIGPPIVCDCLP